MPEEQLEVPWLVPELHLQDAVATGYLAVLSARKGDHSAARALSENLWALKRPYLYGAHTRWRASIAAELGNKDQAVDLLQR